MRKIQYFKIILASALISLPFLLNPSMVRSQFLLDDDEPVIEDYTAQKKQSVKKKKRAPVYEAYNIEAKEISGISNAILLTWDIKSGFTGDFIIGRSTVVPDSRERALAARTVKVISSRVRGVWIDSNLPEGNYYYVILASKRAEKQDFDLARNVNFTSKSVDIKKTKVAGKIKSISGIKARLIGDNVIIVSWNKLTDKGYTYTVYRSTSVLDSQERLNRAEKIAKLSDEGQYIDQNITRGGTYFYSVSFKYLNGKEDTTLKPSDTYIVTGVYAKPLPKKTKTEPYKIINIGASRFSTGIRVVWDFSGKTGNKFMRLYRTRRIIRDMRGVNNDNVIADVDITEGKYIDTNPPEGKHYYGIVPYGSDGEKATPIVSGINITRTPVSASEKEKKQVVKKKPEVDTDDTLIDDRTPFSFEPDYEFKNDNIHEKQTVLSGNIEKIIKRTFFKDRFHDAIKELQAAVKGTDNKKEKALGRLFIGRSYVELGKYSKAVKIFIDRDVASFYPQEAAFWLEYATLRVE